MDNQMIRMILFLLMGCMQFGLPAQNAQDLPPKFVLNAPVTHSDWMLRDGVAWGPEGVHHMLDACKASGWTRVHWRALDGGRSLYKSAMMDPQGKWDPDNFWNPAEPQDRKLMESYTGSMTPESRTELLQKLERYDYGTFDTLAEAVRYGHEIGLEVYAWISVNEDDHGWGLRSRFAKAHPEFCWKKRDGTPYHTQMSFAFPEVMEYKLAVVKEILDNYAVDGLFIDWLRTGDVRDNPQTDAEGVADHGFEEPMLRGFQEKYGVDPKTIPNGDERWVRFRAEPHTVFMRGVRKLATDKRAGMPVAVLVAHPWCYRGMQNKIDGNLRGLLLDLTTWAQEGLINAAAPAGYYMGGGTPEQAYRALQEETNHKTDIWYYTWVPNTPDDFKNDVNRAQALGAKQILLWEGDYIDGRAEKEALQKIMREHAQ
ncbi:MAG TPA: family 10 glycosylhydrolase [Candidatus Hydrogenedentes bacterium]|nr:family 10 glycosylhydrolase [Candidatus Hydrogenedentota bacterium]